MAKQLFQAKHAVCSLPLDWIVYIVYISVGNALGSLPLDWTVYRVHIISVGNAVGLCLIYYKRYVII